VARLGQKLSKKPHSLLVKVNDVETHKQILAYAPKLRFSNTWSQVYIQPDMSLKEREAHKRLYEELKKWRNAGENNLVIQNGKIVSYIPRSHRSHVITNPSTTSNAHEPNKSASATEPNEPTSETAMESNESNAPGDNETSAHSWYNTSN